MSQEEKEVLIEKNKSKLEKLLAQPDIFDCLRRINQGDVKTYEELDKIMSNNQNTTNVQGENQSRRRVTNNKDDEDIQTDKIKEFNILKIEKQPDSLIGGQLRDYQIEGLNWLYKLY